MEDTLFLDHLEEYVQDENRIVTYKWLSRNLEVPVNIAKQMLYSYMVRCKEDPGVQISATYLVSGLASDKQKHQVCIVEEGALEDTKKKFSKLLGVHIYSLQKKNLKDSGCLYMTDYDTGQDHIKEYARWSTIDCSVESSPVNTVTRRPVSNPPLPQLSHTKTAPEGIPSIDSKAPSNKTKYLTLSTKPKTKGHISKMFGSIKSNTEKKSLKKEIKSEPLSEHSNPASTQSETVKPVKDNPPKPVKDDPPKPVKEAPPRQTVSSPVSKPNKTKAVGVFEGLHDSDIDDGDTASDNEKPILVKETKKLVKSRKKNVSKAPKNQPSKEDRQGKRKRVQELSSDEEDSVAIAVIQPPKPLDSNGKRRKKVKRLVPKMYTNEEGEMVTERCWEMVSTDESDLDSVNENKKRKADLKQTKSPGKTKQASLKNFFR